MDKIHVIMPVKDSMDTAREAIRAVMQTPGVDFTVYDDFSSEATTAELRSMAAGLGFRLVEWASLTTHPSPNYRLTLQDAQRRALSDGAHLVVVESDVTVQPDTLQRLANVADQGERSPFTSHLSPFTSHLSPSRIGMVAAVTVDTEGNINFPYLYARDMQGGTVATTKRFSFCCTLLTNALLKAYSFEGLDPAKQWYDVAVSHQSLHRGFCNLLMLDNRVLHRPHSSRPWKQLKYTRPLKYYWLKLTQRRDRI